MKTIRKIRACISLIIVLFLASPVFAVDLGDLSGAAGTLQKGKQVLEAGGAATTAAPGATSGTGLIGLLMQQLGVTQPQAEGGAGALFQLAKSKMTGGDFAALSNSVPEMPSLLAAAPAAEASGGGSMTGDLASMAGGMGGTGGNMLGLAGSFQQLGLAPDMVQKFIPIVVQYVEGSGGSAVAGALQSALMGGM